MRARVLNRGGTSEATENVAAALEEAVRGLERAGLLRTEGVAYDRLPGSDAFEAVREATRTLRTMPLEALATREDRLAFWINAYNLLVIEGVVAFRVRRSVKRVRRFFRRAAYEVAARRFSLDDIEHGVLRGNRGRVPWRARHFAPWDRRRSAAVDPLDPRVHFALVCGARSCPPLRVHGAEGIDASLEDAAQTFISRETQIDPERHTLTTSRLFKWYARDFGRSTEDVIRYLLLHLKDRAQQEYLRENLLRTRVVYRSYDWTLNQLS